MIYVFLLRLIVTAAVVALWAALPASAAYPQCGCYCGDIHVWNGDCVLEQACLESANKTWACRGKMDSVRMGQPANTYPDYQCPCYCGNNFMYNFDCGSFACQIRVQFPVTGDPPCNGVPYSRPAPSPPPVGAIVGGVLGGLLVIWIGVYVYRRYKREAQTNADQVPPPADPPASNGFTQAYPPPSVPSQAFTYGGAGSTGLQMQVPSQAYSSDSDVSVNAKGQRVV
ncbi:hypothetical protein HDU96_008310 [Phlyctochytrium bullatum]|nr:hypothetical protein HDU96_008310 [Phlyctochytrium bullatum]